MSVMSDAFYELFYGSGTWLGILLFLAIVVALMVKWKYSSLLLFPVTIFIGLDYLNEDLIWQAIIMFVISTFLILYLAKAVKK